MPDASVHARHARTGQVAGCNSKWIDSKGRGPDYCKQLLRQQGTRFVDGRADTTQRVPRDELRRRDEAEPVAE